MALVGQEISIHLRESALWLSRTSSSSRVKRFHPAPCGLAGITPRVKSFTLQLSSLSIRCPGVPPRETSHAEARQ